MKALLLAAGLGTRLRPLTLEQPKCLLPIGGLPLLTYHLRSLEQAGITEVLINTHYLAEQVDTFLKQYNTEEHRLKVTAVYEPELLGSAGTLRANQQFFQGEKDFLIVYADNLTDINYTKLLDCHRQKGGLVTIASYYEEHPEQKGIIMYNDQHLILGFKEKPPKEEIISHQANAGMYVVGQDIFTTLNEAAPGLLDFGHHVFPALLAKQAKMYVYMMDEHLLDIGNLENYGKAQLLINRMFKTA